MYGFSSRRVSVLRPSVVSLTVALGWVVWLPEPTEQVHHTDLLGVVDLWWLRWWWSFGP
jgi:hypothetical protein